MDIQLTGHKKKEDKDPQASNDESWHNEGQAPAGVDKGPSYDRAQDVAHWGVCIPHTHDKATTVPQHTDTTITHYRLTSY